MPANFPEVWSRRVRTNFTSATAAPWLDGIAEIDADVEERNPGDKGEVNEIHVPTSEFDVDILINNTAYPIALQDYTDDEVTIRLDKYQSKIITLSDDQVIGAAYDRIDNATKSITRNTLKKKYSKAIHAMGAASNAPLTPVLETTGASFNGRKTLKYDDLVNLKDAFDKIDANPDSRRLVLCSDHYNDLMRDRDRFADLLRNMTTGQPGPVIAGFQIFQYINNPYYNAGAKKPFGASVVAGDYKASIAFVEENVAKKTGLTKIYFADSKTNPTNQTNLFGIRHYFIAMPLQNQFIGALASVAG